MYLAKPALSRRATVALVFGIYTCAGLLSFFYHYLDVVARRNNVPVAIPLIEEFTGAYGAALLVPAVLYFARRHRFHRDRWFSPAILHLLAICVYSFLKTTILWVSRILLFRLFGMGPYDYGLMSVRYFMELPGDVVGYVTVVAAVYLFDSYRALRDREVLLAQAQLQNLRLQLQPHFLFNALNTISSVMYEDPRAADMMLSRLSDLLRITLKSPDAQEIPLSEELANLDAYLKIMQARFEDRLTVDLKVDPGTETALVPQLILQPLVENAIRHGVDPGAASIRVAVSAARSNGSLILKVRDSGPGLPSPAPSWGIGLSNTHDRLGRLYGDRQHLSLENAEGGGLLVTIALPFHA